jgi:hypothetical protein
MNHLLNHPGNFDAKTLLKLIFELNEFLIFIQSHRERTNSIVLSFRCIHCISGFIFFIEKKLFSLSSDSDKLEKINSELAYAKRIFFENIRLANQRESSLKRT